MEVACLPEEEKELEIWDEAQPLRTEARGFSPEQMQECAACRRANPPTRAACLYCGAPLPITEANAAQLKPTLRQLEDWEQGFSAVVLPSEQKLTTDALLDIAGYLKLETEDVQSIFATGQPFPLARAATTEEAKLIENHLARLGFKVLIVSDKELDLNAPKRLRALELTDDSLVLYPAGGHALQRISWQDVTLLVAGRRVVRKLVFAERVGRKNEKELLDSRELNADEQRLDLYGKLDGDGWRITSDSFDFSCLGEAKALVASKNFQTLTGILRERAVNAGYDDSYLRVRQALSLVWPLREHTESLGLRKQGIGRVSTEAATTSDNETQFTRYSRLLHLLKLKGKADDKA